MTDCPTSTTPAGSNLFIAQRLWRAFQAHRKAQSDRRKVYEALRDLNSAHLRDIGYIRDDILVSGTTGKTSARHNDLSETSEARRPF